MCVAITLAVLPLSAKLKIPPPPPKGCPSAAAERLNATLELSMARVVSPKAESLKMPPPGPNVEVL